MKAKERLDIILTERNMFPSREKAKASIMAGLIYVDGQRVDKPGTPVDREAEITIKESLCPYVSRGGLKLEKALALYGFSLKDSVAVDIGASTGGFTDCMLKNGARKVFAIDVGYGQLAWRLRNDPRVVCMERTNVRYLTPEDIPEPLDFGSVDVSFISLRLILPALRGLMKDSGQLICLIKPQFEAGKEKVGKKGVVRDKKVHLEVLEQFLRYAEECHFYVKDVTFSPIRGPEGNIEYLGQLTVAEQPPYTGDLAALVEESHKRLEGNEP